MPDKSVILSEEQIAEIEARCEAATEGPWANLKDYTPPAIWSRGPTCRFEIPHSAADREFIVRAREDVPALCATVRAMREQLNEEQHRNQTQADSIMECEAEITSPQARLKKVTTERDALLKEVAASEGYQAGLVSNDFRTRAINLCNEKAAEWGRQAERMPKHSNTPTIKARAAHELREALEHLDHQGD